MTSFFEFQRQARKKSRNVIVGFVITLVIILLSYNLAIVFLFKEVPKLLQSKPINYQEDTSADSIWFLGPSERDLQTQRSLLIFFTLTFLGAYWYQHRRYEKDSHLLVRVMEAIPLTHTMTNLSEKEKQLLNIVDEMCIASGIPMVKTYVLRHELGINAFTAGHDFKTAHIVITQGALDNLNRDEIQAVVAHEVGHIVSADVRVNMKLMSCIFSLTFIMWLGLKAIESHGRSRRSSSNKGAGQVILFASALVAVGFLGSVFARIFQSMFSRQREYLADAMGVQFTRNPSALASALAKIRDAVRGSFLKAAEAQSISHMCISLSRPVYLDALWASHPPINSRIALLDPQFLQEKEFTMDEHKTRAEDLVAHMKQQQENKKRREEEKELKRMLASLTVVGELEVNALKAQFAAKKTMRNLQQAKLWEILHDQIDFKYCVWAMFLSEDPIIEEKQIEVIAKEYRIEFSSEKLKKSHLLIQQKRDFLNSYLEITAPLVWDLNPYEKDRMFMVIQEMLELGKIETFKSFFYASLYAFCYEPKKENRKLKAQEIHDLFFTFANLQETSVSAGYTLMYNSYHGFPPKKGEQNQILNPTELAEVLLLIKKSSMNLKQQIIQALWTYVRMDGHLSFIEFENMRIIALCFGAAFPPIEALTKETSVNFDKN